MVRRSDRAAGETGRKKKAEGGRGRLRRRHNSNDDEEGMLETQQPGKLSLSNPLIPPDLDEDIDDDLAFNSDDEEKYGHFFQKKSKPDTGAAVKSKKKKKGTSKRDAEGFDDTEEALVLQQLRALGEIDDASDLDFHERDDRGDDDDEYVDLADMFDAAQQQEGGEGDGGSSSKKKSGTKKKKKVDEDGVAKKRRRARVTEEAESLYGPTAVEGSYSSALQQIVATSPATPAQARLQQTLANKRNLISVDVDEHTKEKMVRNEVRDVVAADLAKYNTFLREQREARHVQLPMPMPESNPVPSTLGAIAAAAESRFAPHADAETDATAAAGISGNATRASAFRLANRMNALLSGAGLSRPQLREAAVEDGVVPLGDDDDDGAGAAATQHSDGAEVPAKSYMAKLKAMLSYENARRRRLNRIKSKTYRRILRKEKERDKERREKAFELLHPEKARARLAEKLMKARVEERVTQKHKNTSKWVRHAKRFAQFDGSTKDAIDEQHLLHQKLMQKMEEDADEDEYLNAGGNGRADSEAASSEEERVVDYLIAEASGKSNQQQDADSGEKGVGKKKATSVLWRSIDDEEDEEGDAAARRMTPTEKARVDLRSMKFMQQAREREEKRYADVLEQLQEDIRRDMRGEAVDGDAEPLDLNDGKAKVTSTKTKKGLPTPATAIVGRKAFTQQHDGKKGDESLESIRLKGQFGIDAQAEAAKDSDDSGNVREEEEEEDIDDLSIKDGDSSSSNNGDAGDERKMKSAGSIRKSTKRQRGAKEEFAGSRRPKIPTAGSLGDSSSDTAPSSARKKASSTRVTILPIGTKRSRGDGGAEDAAVSATDVTGKKRERQEEQQLPNDDGEATLQQQQEYLVARAFASDEVDADFLAEKAAQVEAIMKPADKNASLPGWGEWGGADARLNTRHQAKVQAAELQRQIEKTALLKSRADAALDHVIINHDGVELVPDRMLLHMIPRPFSNPAEFARSMRHPHGPEWNSALSFKEANQPRVEVRQGHAVLPLDLSLRGRKKVAKTKRRKTAAAAAA
ncbi:U3 small nucleolar RNA-associated protein 14 [Trypanosoma grayi]|uniref:U3 small nucleolar RNA-associated protein 14 n=1 Tax=Trypanosoma grayi TaxID=71804 RepID=UPI0004F4A476|nr:U3 small nucleolar RNA-associated protein 14 [Trypanosoma grayi]KEG14961.1 U3 small nucleolar RNA-associated protein 14 [Trypanosoma grayi]